MRGTLVVGTAAALAGLAAAVAAAVVGGEAVQHQAADAEGVRAAVSAYYAALNARDIRAMEALWSRDAEPMMIHPTGPQARAPVVGWEAVRRSFEEAWPRFEVFSVTVNERVQVRVGQGGAVAVATTRATAGCAAARRWTTPRSRPSPSSGGTAAGCSSTTTLAGAA